VPTRTDKMMRSRRRQLRFRTAVVETGGDLGSVHLGRHVDGTYWRKPARSTAIISFTAACPSWDCTA